MIDVDFAPPIKLYERWERQQWSVVDYDFAADAAAWAAMRPFTRRELRSGLIQYFLGESAVAETLAPLVQGAPTRDEELYLATQLADEARHTLFFLRYLRAVEGHERSLDEYAPALRDEQADGHRDLFDLRLRAATDRVRSNPGDRAAWYEAVTLYHLIVEAVVAINGERVLLDVVHALGTLPALEDGLRRVARDESRHISFGVGALRRGADAGHRATIADAVTGCLPSVLNVLVDPRRRYPALLPREVIDAQARQLAFLCDSARRALLKRLRYIGLADRLEGIDAVWREGFEAALDEYEQRHGRRHPARAAAPALA